MNIEIRFRLNAEDIQEYALAMPHVGAGKRPPPRKSVLWPILIAILLALMIYIGTSERQPAPARGGARHPLEDWLVSVLPYCLVGLCIAFVLFRARFTKASAQRTLKVNPSLAEEQLYSVSDDGVAVTAETSTASMAWAHFTHLGETEHLLILFVNKTTGHIIPKRAFSSPEVLAEFRDLLRVRIDKRPLGFPVQPPTAP